MAAWNDSVTVSLLWSGWTLEPTDEEMKNWLPEVINNVHKYFGEVRELMNVAAADEAFVKTQSAKPIFGKLQERLQFALAN